MAEIENLTTESTNNLTTYISDLATHEILTLISDQDALVSSAVCSQIPAITAAVDEMVPRLKGGGRVIYFGEVLTYMSC